MTDQFSRNTDPKRREVYELADALLSGAITAEEADRLNKLVSDDVEARWHYVRFMHDSAALRQWGRDLIGAEPVDWGKDLIGAEPVGPEASVSSLEPLVPPIVLDLSSTNRYPLTTTHYLLPTPFVGSWTFSCMVATVIMSVAALVAWVCKVNHHQHIAGAPSKSVPSRDRPEMVFVGRITGMVDVKWSDDPRFLPPMGAHVSLGRKYILDAGLMEITYDSGAKVILQGPCTYEVESTAGGYLALGKLTARVGAGDGGRGAGGEDVPHYPLSTTHYPLFSVRTPTAVVTDLGTEFGVEVSDEGNTTSHVFRGKVKVLVLGGTADSPGSGREVILGENESARVERADGAGQPSIVRHAAESVPSGFVRAMPPPKHVAGSTSYAELVLSLNPAVYYRMERPKDEKDRLVVFDSAPGGHHGELRLADEYGGPPYWSGRFGDSLHLRGLGAGDHAIVPDYPKAANDQLTVSAWVVLESQSMWCAMIAANWGNASTPERPAHGQFHFGLYQSDGDLAVQATQRDQEWLFVREGKDRPLPLGTWLHAAFVADGTTLRLYRNGVEVAAGPYRGILPRPPMASLGIGCKTTTAGTEAATRTPAFWRGRIDELAVFNRALSPAEVRKLAQSSKE